MCSCEHRHTGFPLALLYVLFGLGFKHNCNSVSRVKRDVIASRPSSLALRLNLVCHLFGFDYFCMVQYVLSPGPHTHNFFLRQGFSVYLWLSWNSQKASASASPRLRITAGTTPPYPQHTCVIPSTRTVFISFYHVFSPPTLPVLFSNSYL